MNWTIEIIIAGVIPTAPSGNPQLNQVPDPCTIKSTRNKGKQKT